LIGIILSLDQLRLLGEPSLDSPATIRIPGHTKGSGLTWLNSCTGVNASWVNRRRRVGSMVGAAAHAAEDQQIEEVHPTENE